jgi:catechol 2,3-dioxygenase-like lactoylglutathione lyase family enzyme
MMMMRGLHSIAVAAGIALTALAPAQADVGPNDKPDADGIVLANISIAVADLDRSTNFYKALGFEIGDRRDIPTAVAQALGSKIPDVKLDIRFIKRDGVAIELIHLTPPPTAPASKGSNAQLGLAHIAFRVDDVDRVAKIVKQNGGTAPDTGRVKLGPPGKGVEILFCTDPDGTMMEIAGPQKG